MTNVHNALGLVLTLNTPQRLSWYGHIVIVIMFTFYCHLLFSSAALISICIWNICYSLQGTEADAGRSLEFQARLTNIASFKSARATLLHCEVLSQPRPPDNTNNCNEFKYIHMYMCCSHNICISPHLPFLNYLEGRLPHGRRASWTWVPAASFWLLPYMTAWLPSVICSILAQCLDVLSEETLWSRHQEPCTPK